MGNPFQMSNAQVALLALEEEVRHWERVMWKGEHKDADEFHKRRNLRDMAKQVLGGERGR